MEYKSLPYLGNDVALDGMQRFALPMHRHGVRFRWNIQEYTVSFIRYIYYCICDMMVVG